MVKVWRTAASLVRCMTEMQGYGCFLDEFLEKHWTLQLPLQSTGLKLPCSKLGKNTHLLFVQWELAGTRDTCQGREFLWDHLRLQKCCEQRTQTALRGALGVPNPKLGSSSDHQLPLDEPWGDSQALISSLWVWVEARWRNLPCSLSGI